MTNNQTNTCTRTLIFICLHVAWFALFSVVRIFYFVTMSMQSSLARSCLTVRARQILHLSSSPVINRVRFACVQLRRPERSVARRNWKRFQLGRRRNRSCRWRHWRRRRQSYWKRSGTSGVSTAARIVPLSTSVRRRRWSNPKEPDDEKPL